MAANPEPIQPATTPRRGLRLRQAALLILIVGITIAAIIGYVDVTNPVQTQDNSMMDGYYKHQSAEMQRQTGNFGVVMLSLREDFGQAAGGILIACVSIVIAVTCFLLGAWLDRTTKF